MSAATPTPPELDPQTIAKIQEGYRKLLETGGNGAIHVRILGAGSSRERQIVSVEREEETFSARQNV